MSKSLKKRHSKHKSSVDSKSFTVEFEFKFQKAVGCSKSNSNGVFIQLFKGKTSLKSWGQSKKTFINDKKEAIWSGSTIRFQTHLSKNDSKWSRKVAYIVLCQDGSEPGKFNRLASTKFSLPEALENSSDGEWSENLNLVLERNSENESETPRSKRRCKLDVQIKYKLVKMNQKRLTLVDESNESEAALSSTIDVMGDDYIVDEDESESEEMSEAVSEDDDDMFDDVLPSNINDDDDDEDQDTNDNNNDNSQQISDLNEKIELIEKNLKNVEKERDAFKNDCEGLLAERDIAEQTALDQQKKISDLEKECASLLKESDTLAEQLTAVRRAASEREEELDKQLTQAESRAAALTRKKSELESERDDAKAALATAQSMADIAAQRRESIDDEQLAVLTAERDAAVADADSLRERITGLEAQLAAQSAEDQSALQKHDDAIDTLTAERDALQTDFDALQQTKESLETQLSELQQQSSDKATQSEEKLQQLEEQLGKIDAENNTLKQQLETSNTELDSLKEKCAELQSKVDELSETNQSLQKKVEKLTDSNDALQNDVNQLTEEKASLQAQLDDKSSTADEQALKTIAELREQLEKCETERQHACDDATQLSERVAGMEAALDAANSAANDKLAALEQQNDDAEQQLTALQTQLDERQALVEQLQLELKETQQMNEGKTDAVVDELREKLDEQQQQAKQSKMALVEKEKLIEQLKDEQDEIKQQLQASHTAMEQNESISEELKNIKTQLKVAENECEKLQKQRDDLKSQLKNNNNNNNNNKKNKNKNDNNIILLQTITSERDQLKNELNELKKDFEKKQKENSDDEENISELKAYCDRLEGERDELESTLQSVQKQLKTIEESKKQSHDDDDNESFQLQLFQFLETQIYNGEVKFVPGAHCPQVASRVFYQLSEWHVFDENTNDENKNILKRVLSALKTLSKQWSLDEKHCAHAITTLVSLRRLIRNTKTKSDVLPSHVIEFVTQLDHLLTFVVKQSVFLINRKLEPTIVDSFLRSAANMSEMSNNARNKSSGTRTLCSLLDDSQNILNESHVPKSIIIYVLTQSVRFIAETVCNAVLIPKSKLANAQNGFSVKMESSLVQEWAGRQGNTLREAVFEAFAPAMQLATILVMDKAILKDSQVLQEICPSLNARQVHSLVVNYKPDELVSEPVPLNVSVALLEQANAYERRKGIKLKVMFDTSELQAVDLTVLD